MDYEEEHYETNYQEESQEHDDDLDEDDQDNYEWHEDNGRSPTMDIYMSESRIMDQELEISRNQEQEISRN